MYCRDDQSAQRNNNNNSNNQPGAICVNIINCENLKTRKITQKKFNKITSKIIIDGMRKRTREFK